MPTLEQYKKQLQVARAAIVDCKDALSSTEATSLDVQKVAAEAGVSNLAMVFENCRRQYASLQKEHSRVLLDWALQFKRLSEVKPDLSLYWGIHFPRADFELRFKEYLRKLLLHLKEAERRAHTGKTFWSAMFDRRWYQETIAPLDCVVALVKDLDIYDECFQSKVYSFVPRELLQTHEYRHRKEAFSMRLADFLSEAFIDHWESVFQELAREHNRLVQELRSSFWPNMEIVFRAVKHPLLQKISAFVRAAPAIAAFEANCIKWAAETFAPEFLPENWLQGYSRRGVLVPSFGAWPFPRKFYPLTKETFRKRIRDYKKKVNELKLKIAVLEKEHDDEALHSKLQELQDEVSKHELEKAAAAAHWGDIRKTAASVRSRIEKEVAGGSTCPYCGNGLGANWHADHIYPVKLGGLSSIQNMVAVCIDCNLKKGDRTLAEFAQRYQLDLLEISARLRLMDRRC